jgi:hypothetical protein
MNLSLMIPNVSCLSFSALTLVSFWICLFPAAAAAEESGVGGVGGVGDVVQLGLGAWLFSAELALMMVFENGVVGSVDVIVGAPSCLI